MPDYDELARSLRRPLAPYFHSFDGTRDLGRGTAFPTTDVTLAAGDRFWRTDLGLACYYDGARWLTVAEYVMPLVYLTTISGPTDSGNIPIPASLALGGFYAVRATVVTNAAATNNGSNFWTIQVQGINTANTSADVLYGPTTAADTAGVYTAHEGIATQVPTNKTWCRTNASKTGTPGNLTYAATLAYRLIVT